MGGWDILQKLGLGAALDPRLDAFWHANLVAPPAASLEELSPYEQLRSTTDAERLLLARQCGALVRRGPPNDDYYAWNRLLRLFNELVKPPLPYSDADLAELLESCSDSHSAAHLTVLRLIEQRYEGKDLPPALRNACSVFRGRLTSQFGPKDRRLLDRLSRLSQTADERASFKLSAADAWSAALVDFLARLSAAEREPWLALLRRIEHPTGSKPSAKWLKQAGGLIERIGLPAFNAGLLPLLERVGVEHAQPVLVPGWEDEWMPGHPTLISQRHSDLLKGLLWAAAPGADEELVQAIGDAAERCFKKVPGVGPRAPKIGNACLQALAVAGAPNAIAQLSRLQGRVKHNSSRTQVARALDQAAQQAGVSRDALEDMAAPSCGLTGVGRLERSFGEYRALVELRSSRDFALEWRKADGKLQKAVPVSVKAEHPTELKQLKLQLKELEQQLPAQLRRVERMLLSQRTLSAAEFRERFVRHPLLGFLSRRLLWRVVESQRVCALQGEQLLDVAEQPVELREGDRVGLWHPLHSDVQEVQSWRRWLEEHAISQPFKQAHREIYLLTDAERQTAHYSNRFAAHVLKQHQFHALCRERGWHYTLQGGFDSHNTPHLTLPDHDLTVEYWVDGAAIGTAELSAAGIYLYVVTDQVRFRRPGQDEPLPLELVPPLVFSELMRDVDLFVGVCSVGNDPNWHDSGDAHHFAGYWQSYAFGALGESAKTRRGALERLLPRLKIAGQCTLEERFLVVRGRFRTYRIHLGSANIQMDPGNQYLCIVPSRSPSQGPSNVMLPFEGDGTLSLILSKAIMLADDHEITDPSIQSQIGSQHYQVRH